MRGIAATGPTDEKRLPPSPQRSSRCLVGTPCQEHSLLQPLAVLGRAIAEHKHQETPHFLLQTGITDTISETEASLPSASRTPADMDHSHTRVLSMATLLKDSFFHPTGGEELPCAAGQLQDGARGTRGWERCRSSPCRGVQAHPRVAG